MASRSATIPPSGGRRWTAQQCPSQLETVRRDGGTATRTGGAQQWGDGGVAAVREATRQGEMEMESGRTSTRRRARRRDRGGREHWAGRVGRAGRGAAGHVGRGRAGRCVAWWRRGGARRAGCGVVVAE